MSTSEELRQAILAARDFRKVEVPAPEWGLSAGLFVRSISVLDALAFGRANKEIEDAKTPSLYLAYCLCDSEGRRIFDPEKDLDELCGKHTDVISRLFHQALDVNGLGKEAEAEREKP